MNQAAIIDTGPLLAFLCAGVDHHEWWTGVQDRTERIRGILRGLAKVLPERTTAEPGSDVGSIRAPFTLSRDTG